MLPLSQGRRSPDREGKRVSVRDMSWIQNHPRLLEVAYARTYAMLRPFGHWLRRGGAVERLFVAGEKLTKGPVFDCRMCGQCILHNTGMTCPMTCPKTMRNGPCGGVRPDGRCEIKPEMVCVWVMAWERSQRMPTFGNEISACSRRSITGLREAQPGSMTPPETRRGCRRGGADDRALAPGTCSALGTLRRHGRAQPAGQRRCPGGVRAGIGAGDGVRCHQRHRRLRRQRSHVQCRRFRAADARRLRAGAPGVMPRSATGSPSRGTCSVRLPWVCVTCCA